MSAKAQLQTVAIEVARQASWRFSVQQFTDTAMTQPADLTGYTPRLRIWRHPYETSPVFDCSATPRMTSASIAIAKCEIDIPAARMAASTLDGQEYQIRIDATSGTDKVELLRGTWTPRD